MAKFGAKEGLFGMLRLRARVPIDHAAGEGWPARPPRQPKEVMQPITFISSVISRWLWLASATRKPLWRDF